VRDALVSAWQDARGDTQLVGHIIAAQQPAPTPAQIRAWLREHLPEVMIPPYFLFAESFPQTGSGKVQRAALPTPDTARLPAPAPAELPETPTERQLAAAWAQVLGLDLGDIGRDADFIDLGGHSLLMTPLMLEIRQRFQVSFSLREFFDAPTLRQFAALIDVRRQAQANHQPDSRPARTAEWGRQRMAFLLREADLPPTLTPARGMRYQPGPYNKVLLTGGTGFLGAYLIAEILDTTTAQVYCLVRPKRGEDGKARIERQMRHYAVWRSDEAWRQAWTTRLHVVDGDVTLPRMGVADAAYETLARDIDAILHGAAHVNFIYPYEALRGTNVIGIHEIIRFAFDTRIKPVHHLSTAAIWPMGAQFTFYEKDPIEHGQVLNLGYDEAKWVGERCLLNAQERGLPVARYRPGEVGGDSVTGRCVTDHFLIASIKGFLQFGAFPALDINVDVAPVDYVSRAMIHLMFKRNALGRAFHLTNPHPRPMREALGFLRGLGYHFDEMRFVELRDRLVNSRDFAANALFAYQATLEDMDDTSLQLPTYDTRQTQRELRPAGIVCPAADEKLFGLYLRYLQDIGFIPAPARLPAPV
jgi:thioester reductase-like protein